MAFMRNSKLSNIHVDGLLFKPFLSGEQIHDRVEEMSVSIQHEVMDSKKPSVFIGILNGAYRFLTDLTNPMSHEVEIDFMGMKSYDGTQRGKDVTIYSGLRSPLKGKHAYIVEDIIDTGHTMNHLLKQAFILEADKVSLVTLLFKPEAFEFDFPIDHIGFEIPNDFVVGYGLDYNGHGRTLDAIYSQV
jgi:hypoxanthine phosphoribosyltransferase